MVEQLSGSALQQYLFAVRAELSSCTSIENFGLFWKNVATHVAAIEPATSSTTTPKKSRAKKNTLQTTNDALNITDISTTISSLYQPKFHWQFVPEVDAVIMYDHFVPIYFSKYDQVSESQNCIFIIIQTSTTGLLDCNITLSDNSFTLQHTIFAQHSKPINNIRIVPIHIYATSSLPNIKFDSFSEKLLVVDPVPANELPVEEKTPTKKKTTTPSKVKLSIKQTHPNSEYNFNVKFWELLLEAVLPKSYSTYPKVLTFTPVYGTAERVRF